MSRTLPNAVRWCLALVVGLYLGRGASGAEPPKTYLELDITFSGRGSVPEVEVDEPVQEWTVERTYRGYVEVVVESVTVGGPTRPITLLSVKPLNGGVSTLVGTLRDSASTQFSEVGEGGSSMEFSGFKEWSSTAFLKANQFPAELFLHEAGRTWTGSIPLGFLQEEVRQRQNYRGYSRSFPGPGGGWSEPWEYYTTDPNDSSGDGRAIYSGYHPGAPPETTFRLVNHPATIQAGYYTGVLDVVFPPPEGYRGEWSMRGSLRWTLRDQLPDVELRVICPSYARWRPTLAEDGGPGWPLIFAAGVESPTKESLQRIRVRKFVWTLHDTSREPGVSMNFPPRASASTTPDLVLVGGTVTADGQRTEETPPEGVLGSAIDVEPRDWGAWSTLRVQAELDDGRVLQGEMDLGSGERKSDIPLPKRTGDSKIADSWKLEQRVSGKADDADDEEQPVGKPGAIGDGLSLYEEYRGFYVNEQHVGGDPRRKELFVRNDGGAVGGLADRAIRRFEAVSRLKVHRPNVIEFNPFVVAFNHINANRSAGPTRGPQGGLWLAESGRLRGSYPAGSRPRTHGRVVVPRSMNGLPAGFANEDTLERIVMQGMFQALGVERPGPDDPFRTFELRLPPPGTSGDAEIILLPSTRVVVIDFFGDDFARKWQRQVTAATGRLRHQAPPGSSPAEIAELERQGLYRLTRFHWLVGEKGGSHSGPEECVMRDWFADVYRTRSNAPDGRPVYRLIDPPRGAERPGSVLGTTRQGTGVNAPDRVPEPRYGDSGASAPANRQLVVSDSAP